MATRSVSFDVADLSPGESITAGPPRSASKRGDPRRPYVRSSIRARAEPYSKNRSRSSPYLDALLVEDEVKPHPKFFDDVYKRRIADLPPAFLDGIRTVGEVATNNATNSGASFITANVIPSILQGAQIMAGLTRIPDSPHSSDPMSNLLCSVRVSNTSAAHLQLTIDFPPEFNREGKHQASYNFETLCLLHQRITDDFPRLSVGFRIPVPYAVIDLSYGGDIQLLRAIPSLEVSIRPKRDPSAEMTATTPEAPEHALTALTPELVAVWKRVEPFDAYRSNLTDALAEYGCRDDSGNPIKVVVSSREYAHGKYMRLESCTSITPRIAACVRLAHSSTQVTASGITGGPPCEWSDTFESYCKTVKASMAEDSMEQAIYIKVDE